MEYWRICKREICDSHKYSLAIATAPNPPPPLIHVSKFWFKLTIWWLGMWLRLKYFRPKSCCVGGSLCMIWEVENGKGTYVDPIVYLSKLLYAEDVVFSLLTHNQIHWGFKSFASSIITTENKPLKSGACEVNKTLEEALVLRNENRVTLQNTVACASRRLYKNLAISTSF